MTDADKSKPIDARTLAIRALHDRFRQTFNGGRVVATAGIMALDEPARLRIFVAVQAFEAFDEGNDPSWRSQATLGRASTTSARSTLMARPSSSRSTTWHLVARCIPRTQPTRQKPSGS